ncbi:hypothetical protein [Acetobacter sp. P1H12_c]|uniref:hypothetical protein n=1 Tax=Acetobacter sp. P1H12_c TaxID=2762621 RepID=UPI001C055125|nr:hypothetical protein [Acetobacter sp. P1H12_c]
MPFHTKSHGVDVGALKRGIVKATALASAAGLDVIYLLPSFAHADGDALVELIGKSAVETFKKNRETTINGVRFHMETALKKRTSGPAIVLAMNISLEQLTKAQTDHRTADLVYIIWSDVELAQYEAANPSSVAI